LIRSVKNKKIELICKDIERSSITISTTTTMETPVSETNQKRNVFKMSLKNQHLLAFAFALTGSSIEELCSKIGLDLSTPVNEQNDVLETVFWADAKNHRKAFNDHVRKTILKPKKNKDKPVKEGKRKYVRRQKEEGEEEPSAAPVEKRKYVRRNPPAPSEENAAEEQQQPKQKRKYTRKPKEESEPVVVDAPQESEPVVVAAPQESEVRVKRKYTKKEKKVEGEPVPEEVSSTQQDAAPASEVVAVQEEEAVKEVPVAPKKRGPKKKEESTEEATHPFDKFRTKLNKKILDESSAGRSTVDQQKSKLSEVIRVWLNTASTNRSTQDVLHLVRTEPQYIQLLDNTFRTSLQEEYAGVVVGAMTTSVVDGAAALRLTKGEDGAFVVEIVGSSN